MNVTRLSILVSVCILPASILSEEAPKPAADVVAPEGADVVVPPGTADVVVPPGAAGTASPAAPAAAEAAPLPTDPVLREIELLKRENQSLNLRLSKIEGQDAAGTKPEEAPGKWDIKKGLTFQLKGDVRLRNEQLWNAFDLDSAQDDNWNSTRLRTRVGFGIDYAKLVGAYIQLTAEHRWGSDTKQVPNFQAEDIRVDNAYLRISKPWDLPLTFTGGRQDLLADPSKGWRGMYGEGWLLFDGTPNDGSATISFDSAKLRWEPFEETTVDLMYAKLSDLTTAGRTIANSYSQFQFDEDLVALYGITRPKLGDERPLQLELYTMYRDKNLSTNYNPAPTPFSPDPMLDPRLFTVAFGGRISTPAPLLDKHLSFGVEGAYQTGELTPGDVGGTGYIGSTPYALGDDVRRDAFGAYAWARLNLDQEVSDLNPWLELRFDYMSGDDPDTQGKFEGWDSMYGEWPKYSELLIYTFYDPFAPAHGEADPNLGAFSNMYFPTVTVGCYPVPAWQRKVSLKAAWGYWMSANDENSPNGDPNMGNLFHGLVEFIPYPFLRTHLYFDYFLVGDYYTSSADNAWFSRVEFMFLF